MSTLVILRRLIHQPVLPQLFTLLVEPYKTGSIYISTSLNLSSISATPFSHPCPLEQPDSEGSVACPCFSMSRGSYLCINKMRGGSVAGRRKKSRSFDDSDCTISEYALRRLCDMGWDWRFIFLRDFRIRPGTVMRYGMGLEVMDADPRAFLQTWDKAENEGTEEDKKTLMIAKSVATSTIHIMQATYMLCDLKIALSEKEYRGFFLSVFGCLSNVVFSLLDMDDFVMICDGSRWLEEYKKFCSDLNSEDSVASQKVEGNTFSVLREHDLFCALKGLQGTDEDSGCEELLWGRRGPFTAEPNDDIIEVAEAVIKRCRALKRDERMRLSLEMMLDKQYIVYDTLVLRALCGMVSGELHYGSEAADTVSHFKRRLVSQLSYMMDTKSRRMKRLVTALTFPLLDKSIFGPCNKEVVELIKFADFERRMRNEHFITSKDVLFCLSLTRVGPYVKRLLAYQRRYEDLSLFMLYKLSREMAGSGNDMMLEHLVMALFGEKYKSGFFRSVVRPPVEPVFNSAAWNGDLQGRLGLSGYEQRDVKIWNSSKSWFDYDKLAACSSHGWILGKHAGMYECDFGLYARR